MVFFHPKSHDRDFVAADCGFVVLATAAARLDGDQVLSRRQIGIERELHPCGVGMEKRRLHHPFVTALRAAFNPYAFLRIFRIYRNVVTSGGNPVSGGDLIETFRFLNVCIFVFHTLHDFSRPNLPIHRQSNGSLSPRRISPASSCCRR